MTRQRTFRRALTRAASAVALALAWHPDTLVAQALPRAATLAGHTYVLSGSGFDVLLSGPATVVGHVEVTGSTSVAIAAASLAVADIAPGAAPAPTRSVDFVVIATTAPDALLVYDTGDPASPRLVSVVQLPQAVTSLRIDSAERVAHVGQGTRGIVVVDLEGSYSTQPIDLDRDGIDDRLLGVADTPGTALASAREADAPVTQVADGAAGLTGVQVSPSRVRVIDLRRDPVLSTSRDDTSILETRLALVTDAAVVLRLDNGFPSDVVVSLTLEHAPAAAGGRVVTLPAGTDGMVLPPGQSDTSLAIVPGGRGRVTVRATAAGQTVATVAFHVVDVVPVAGTLVDVEVRPEPVQLSLAAREVQLSVGARFSDGQYRNVTRGVDGTTYDSSDPAVAAVGADGLVSAQAGGRATIEVRHGGFARLVPVIVSGPAAVTALSPADRYVTLTEVGEASVLDVRARLSTGATREASTTLVSFTSTDTSVATVDPSGRVTAVGPGVSEIVLRAGAVEQRVRVAVEPRVTPDITGLTLDPVLLPVASDEGGVLVSGRVAGTGSIQGVPVTALVAGRNFGARTLYDGTFVFAVTGLHTPGGVVLTASLTNPAGGNVLSATLNMVVERQGQDVEPNDTLSDAVPVQVRAQRVPVTGTVGGGDARDAYRVPLATAGTLLARITLPPGVDPSGVVLRGLRADGGEVTRLSLTGSTGLLRVPVDRGAALVEILGGALPVSYSLVLDFEQGPVTITSVTPPGGPPGTVVTIDGSGFDTTPDATRVYFGGVVGTTQAVTSTRVTALVPALAVIGPVRVVSGNRRAESAALSFGQAGPPQVYSRPADPSWLRRDPVSGATVNISRLAVFASPDATPAQMTALAIARGGEVAGINAVIGCYFMEFRGHAGFEDLERTRAALATDPRVRQASVLRDHPVVSFPVIDATSRPFTKPVAFDAVRAYAALSLVRRTPPFDDPAALRPVKVAVIDTGFDPANPADFLRADGTSVVTYYGVDASGRYVESEFADPLGHGTAVASIIAAMNDGVSPLTGVLGGLYSADEEPEPFLRVFGAPGGDNSKISAENAVNALSLIALMGDVDAVNLSFGQDFADAATVINDANYYAPAVHALRGRTLVVIAAGNGGVQATHSSPPFLAAYMPHVVAVGATAVANGDGTGEQGDTRAIFGSAIPKDLLPVACDPAAPLSGSNCGSAVGLAASGEDFMVATPTCNPVAGASLVPCQFTLAPGVTADSGDRGTSYAAPLVAGAAGLLRALTTTLPTPTDLKRAVIDTADDITTTWGGGTMSRLNVLSAVLPYVPARLLPQRVLVADEEASVNGGTGAVIGLAAEVDSAAVGTGAARVTPLAATIRGTAFSATRPGALVVSPIGDEAYLVVRSISPDLGDGILVFDTLLEHVTDFIPLSGARIDAPAPGGATVAPVLVPDARTPLAVSPDGRLLYVAVGLRVVVVNLVDRLVVRSFADLPSPYNALAADFSAGELDSRLADVTSAASLPGAPATKFSAMDISQDGNELYLAVQTGNGPGVQPGRMLVVDVGLYLDDDPATPGLQSALSTYLVPGVTLGMSGTAQDAGDEPSAIAVDTRFDRAYLVNGGLDGYTIIPASPEELSLTLQVSQALFGDVTIDDLRELTDVGGTLIRARGFTGVFDFSAASPVQELAFPSDVNFGWNSSARVVTQFNHPAVLAKRPMGLALRRSDTSRALVSFFQTGNFGLLDMNAQAGFLTPPQDGVPNPLFGSLSNDQFHGLVGVTPSIPLDSHLWPKRGRLPRGDGVNYVPSPDEALLYAGPIVYAQNGRFAVATHTGVGRSERVSFTMPLFATPELEARLAELGIPFQAGGTVELNRKGGAISIIDDEAIDVAIGRASTSVASGTRRWPALAATPLCTYDPSDPATCTGSVVSSQLHYTPEGGTPTRFERPRGVGIQPFVYIERPRYRDHVVGASLVQIGWRDEEASEIKTTVVDLDVTGASTVVGRQRFTLSDDDRIGHVFVRRFGGLFDVGKQPLLGHRYQISVELLRPGSTSHVARQVIEVVCDDVGQALRLTPELSFVVAVPGSGAQLNAQIAKLDGSLQDVTSGASYQWIGRGFRAADVPGFEAARVKVQQALGLPPGTTLPVATISVDAAGAISVQSPGVQAIRATHPEASAASNFSILLAGFDLAAIELEPAAPFGATPTPVGDQFLFAERNTPLVLSPVSSDVARQDGLATLRSVLFSYLGSGRVSATDLSDLATAGGSGSFTLSFTDPDSLDAMLTAAESISFGNEMRFTARGPLVADLSCPAGAPAPGSYAACVQARDSGLTTIGGRLDLASIGLGAKSDDLAVLVLPRVQSAEFDPPPPTIDRRGASTAGPVIETLACLVPVTGDLSLPADYPDVATFVAAWMPPEWPTTGAPARLPGVGGVSAAMTATLVPSGFAAAYTISRLCLQVPTDATPGVTSSGYQQLGPQLVTVVRQSAVASQLQHLGVSGQTTLQHVVTLDGLGTATATSPLVVCDCVPQPLGAAVLVTEMVLSPRRDWNDSSGGNGTPFDTVPGNGTVDGNDVWVEVASLTVTATWTIRLTDAGGARYERPLGAGTLGSQVHVVSGFGVQASPVVRLEVVDDLGTIRFSLDVAAVESLLGPATGPQDESLTWSVTGSPTFPTQQFVRRPASINQFLPF